MSAGALASLVKRIMMWTIGLLGFAITRVVRPHTVETANADVPPRPVASPAAWTHSHTNGVTAT
jgi:hypothetical protein